jgi:hypothetical protein
MFMVNVFVAAIKATRDFPKEVEQRKVNTNQNLNVVKQKGDKMYWEDYVAVIGGMCWMFIIYMSMNIFYYALCYTAYKLLVSCPII